MFRRTLVVALAGALAAMAVTPSFAQANWPSKAITLVVPQPPGGGTDVLGRLWADFVSRSLNATIVVENKAGANGVVASTYVAKQPADGHTIMVAGVSYLAFNPWG
jgi:tripartite-type tricarboxylate transporter receptor subunit TctC